MMTKEMLLEDHYIDDYVDDHVDREIESCFSASSPKNFFVFAGAAADGAGGSLAHGGGAARYGLSYPPAAAVWVSHPPSGAGQLAVSRGGGDSSP